MSGAGPRVIKLGGSLLECAEWVERFRRWFSQQPAIGSVLVTGGGILADAVRQLDRIHRLDASDAHWLAIGTMSLTSRLVQGLLPEAGWSDRWQTLGEQLGGTRLVVFDPREFLETIEPTAGGEPLPHGWQVTSDSIAARVAEVLGAEELVLLKSSLPEPPVATLKQAADRQYVDRCFPRFAARVRAIRCINLRDEDFPEIRFQRS
jgi:5-(aminomethyl)-3-furanmethanol phosphate kinase